MPNIVIALGANLGEKGSTLTRAVTEIGKRIGSVLAVSRFIETEPLLSPDNPTPQPTYLNGVLLANTELSAERVLEILLDIERELGRVRGVTDRRWGARMIDLDLITFGDEVIRTETLTIPHPEMHKRDFVLKPMLEVAPDWKHPVLRKTVRELFSEI